MNAQSKLNQHPGILMVDVGTPTALEEVIQCMDTGSSSSIGLSDLLLLIRKAIEELKIKAAQIDAYKQALDDDLVLYGLGVAQGDPKAELKKLIEFHIQLALDPKISRAAQALIDRGRREFIAALDTELSGPRTLRPASNSEAGNSSDGYSYPKNVQALLPEQQVLEELDQYSSSSHLPKGSGCRYYTIAGPQLVALVHQLVEPLLPEINRWRYCRDFCYSESDEQSDRVGVMLVRPELSITRSTAELFEQIVDQGIREIQNEK